MVSQRIVKDYSYVRKYRGAKLWATLDYEYGEIYWEEHEQYHTHVSLSLLKKVVSKYPEGKTIMILDNAHIQHAQLIQPFLRDKADGLEHVFLPPYSPQINLIEGLWAWLKKSVIYNVFFSTVEAIRAAVISFMDEICKNCLLVPSIPIKGCLGKRGG